ncbi:MAG: cytochrome c1 [Alphaproteobacteria bacterium]|nr:cytochrome c1 [Alphaproteobacteria bacterium]
MRIAQRLGLAVGAGLVIAALWAGASVTATAQDAQPDLTKVPVGEALPPKDVSFSFQGMFGTYNKAALQRGFQVYKEVCSACHSMNLVAFHDLGNPGGPDFTAAQVKAIAASYQVPAGPNSKGQTTDANGQPLMRSAIPADHFPPPFPNEEAARTANNGALPPDMSLLAKALDGGPARIYSIVTGFHLKPPPGFKVVEGKYFNPWFPGWNISMPPPLTDGSVTYTDGTKATLDQEAHDVATFLMWCAEPKLDQRKRVGFEVMIFLVVLSGLLYLSYRRIWKDMH